MAFEAWIAFAAASILLLIIPGPTVLMVISYSLSQGKRAAVASVTGVMLGDLFAITAALAGLGALLATSAMLFQIMKYIGAAYLIYIGIKMWRSNSGPSTQVEMPHVPALQIFRDTLLVTTFNPKGMLFFVAFLPQFVDHTQPVLTQFFILGLTFVTLGGINTVFWVSMAGGLRKVVNGPSTLKRLNKVGGTGLLGAGIFTALSGRVS
ncbi:Homoserine/homoserine lactone efflux protein [Pseudovibrio sp. Ad13]|uniref:LysE family translocator n=1 Tax=Pseudovibrio sp. Ad13 TaxID=989396 RepID=UPI0007AE7CAA|nr:LysE family translocator [Pseudovibrio sp. Ad13]KZK83145.1 Homoserine/homoserine lactone efflux protein [Pseudovibrio sp. Ad13]